MQELKEFFKDKTNLRNFIILLVVIVALPLGIYLAINRQIFFSRADRGSPIEVLAGNCVVEKNGKKSLKCAEVPLKLVSPLGPPVNATSPLPSASSQPTSSPSANPSNSPSTSSPSPGVPSAPSPSPTQQISFVSQPALGNSKGIGKGIENIIFTTNICPQSFSIANDYKGKDKPESPLVITQFNCTQGHINQNIKGFVVDDKKGSCNELTVTATGADGSQATSNILKWCSNNDG